MEPEPQLHPVRDAEALLLVVDTSPPLDVFERLRTTAFRLARTRLLYSVKDDILGLFAAGSSTTNNTLADQNPGGYLGLQALVPPVANRLRAVRAAHSLIHGSSPSKLLDTLDVTGDTLCQTAAIRNRHRRLIVLTAGDAMLRAGTIDQEELDVICGLCREEHIQVDFVVDCTDTLAEEITKFDDLCEDDVDDNENGDEESPSIPISVLAERAKSFTLAPFLIVAHATNGAVLPLSEAITQADLPTPRSKRAMAKFRGTLDLAGILQIPVKRFSFTAEASAPSAKRLSWDASRRLRTAVGIFTETQRVASARADVPLAPEEIVNAFPYGPDLVPEPTNSPDVYAWAILRERGLHVLGFIMQSSVPQRLFLSNVDVIIPMQAIPEAKRALRSLAIALQTERMGILARSVVSSRGGAPVLCYIWPHLEIDSRSRAVKNAFFFAVNIPMREDVRDMPFEGLKSVSDDAAGGVHNAMDKLIDATMLEPMERNGDAVVGATDSEEDEDDESNKPFTPWEFANPNLDWFHICIVHRALQGIDGDSLPPLSEWHEKLMDPKNYIRCDNREAYEEAVTNLKSTLPIMPVQQRAKRGRRVYEAVNGDLASLVHYLPEASDDEEDVEGHDDDEQKEYGEVFAAGHESFSEVHSELTDLDVDVGESTPVEDFENLVGKGKFRMGAASLQVIVRRLIREVVDDDKAMQCLQALRRVSAEKHQHHFFNDFVSSLVRRCERNDAVGNRTAAFIRYVHKRGGIADALEVIPIARAANEVEATLGDQRHREFLAEVSADIRRICSKPDKEISASHVTS